MKVAVIALSLALAGAASAREAPLPEGWRRPTNFEVAYAVAWLRKEFRDVDGFRDPNFSITADFDGDGKRDRAQLLIRKSDKVVGLFVARASSGDFVRLGDGEDTTWLAHFNLQVAKPGTYVDVVDFGDDRPPPEVRTSWPSIYVGYGESSSQIFYWDGHAFATVWLSD